MSTIKLQQVKNFDKLLRYLETELGWPVEGREIDDIAFPFDLESDLGLDKNEVAKVRHVYRLKKMHKKQPFGIFFVDFEGKKMPVSVLKRILRNLALKRRANARAADQLAWDVEDLIFISAVGEEKDSTREISFAHFRKEPDNRHVLKVMAWDGGDTPLKMDHLDEVLHEYLRFPDDTNDIDAWRKSWTDAFRTGLRQNIRRSEELAQALAALAMRINKEALSLIKKESANGPLKTLHAGFKDALIHDLTEEAFTDCYAQTITYGLLTAAITKVNQAGVKDLTSTSVLEMVPSTNPFLKDILSSFLEAGGRGQKGIDFDDLGVQDVIDLLRAESTDLPNILRDFGNLTQDEDPVIHFYETFLKIYNKDERVKRGAFYTPRPVVSYIVRSVDELLRKEFGLEDGLADTTTWGEMIKRNAAIKLPPLTDNPGEKKTIKETEPFVQILDPATGTATFLVEVINIIEKTVKAKAWSKLKNGRYDHGQHSKRDEVLKAWNEYVPEHLLKRLHAYEIMMAPYVIAHMKVGLKLAETGYQFATEERARIYLTNALEPAKDFKDRLNIDLPQLAVEAREVNAIKNEKRFTVIVGNPPYSVVSYNQGRWITDLCETYKVNVRETERQIQALSDDYIKFIRLSEWHVARAGIGVSGLITNNGFLGGKLFIDVRSSLRRTFRRLEIVDLHGDIRSGENGPDGRREGNVFDIQTGVCITLCSAGPGEKIGLHKTEVYGVDGQEKYSKLDKATLGDTIDGRHALRGPNDAPWLERDESLDSEWGTFVSIKEIFGTGNQKLDAQKRYAAGFVAQQDDFAISFTKEEVITKVKQLLKPDMTEKALREIYDLCTTNQWSFSRARDELSACNWRQLITTCTYRPFDRRWTLFHRSVVTILRKEVMRHMRKKDNIALLVTRGIGRHDFRHVYVSDDIVDRHAIDNVGDSMFVFPLHLHEEDDKAGLDFINESIVNLNPKAISLIREKSKLGKTVDPIELFGYIYAVLNSGLYRSRYQQYLVADFPSVPLPKSEDTYLKLSDLGTKLVNAHVQKEGVDDSGVKEVGASSEVERPHYEDGVIWFNKKKTYGVSGVSKKAIEYKIGGFEVLLRWLKYRKDTKLTPEQVDELKKIINYVERSILLTEEIDVYIASLGGFSKAFITQ